MIEIDFERFHNQDYSEEGFDLYIAIHENGTPLYVGISTRSVWERWFGWNGHMIWNGDFINGSSLVGQKIVDNLPESLHWKIQLWTLADCVAFCKDVLPPRISSPTIQYIEPFMIQKLSPVLNATYNLNPGKDITPISEREKMRVKNIDDWYDKIFNKK